MSEQITTNAFTAGLAFAGATNIVSSFLMSGGTIPLAELSNVTRKVQQSLMLQPTAGPVGWSESEDKTQASKETIAPKPAVPIDQSVFNDYLVSLETGEKLKTLKRHLATRDMTPDQYREKWDLPADYPMVCAAYSAARSSLARNQGLGNKKPTDARSQSDTVKGLVANTGDGPEAAEPAAGATTRSRSRRATKQPAEATA